jgi:hypothetical protein
MKSGDTHNKDSLPGAPAEFNSLSLMCSAIRVLVHIDGEEPNPNCERDDEHAPHVRRDRANGPIFGANNPHMSSLTTHDSCCAALAGTEKK